MSKHHRSFTGIFHLFSLCLILSVHLPQAIMGQEVCRHKSRDEFEKMHIQSSTLYPSLNSLKKNAPETVKFVVRDFPLGMVGLAKDENAFSKYFYDFCGKKINETWLADLYKDKMSSPASKIMLAMDVETNKPLAIAIFAAKTGDTFAEFYLDLLCSSQSRGGMGKLMLGHLEEELLENRKKTSWISLEPIDTAKGFYVKQGFQSVPEREGHPNMKKFFVRRLDRKRIGRNIIQKFKTKTEDSEVFPLDIREWEIWNSLPFRSAKRGWF